MFGFAGPSSKPEAHLATSHYIRGCGYKEWNVNQQYIFFYLLDSFLLMSTPTPNLNLPLQ